MSVFLPKIKGTKRSFMSDVLTDKKASTQAERDHPPGHSGLPGALHEEPLEPVLTKYIPIKELLSNKQP